MYVHSIIIQEHAICTKNIHVFKMAPIEQDHIYDCKIYTQVFFSILYRPAILYQCTKCLAFTC